MLRLEVVGGRKKERARERETRSMFLGPATHVTVNVVYVFPVQGLNSTKRFSVELRNRIQYGLKTRA